MIMTPIVATFLAIGLAGGAMAQTTHGHTEGMTHDQSTMSSDPMIKSTTTTHTDGMDHSAMADHGAAMPSEPGQGAFAAVSEIVVMLSNDPNTDWSRVNIGALREHLVDMDMLITNAQVTSRDVENGIEMRINLAELGGGAASRMVPAHGPVLQGEVGWQSDVTVGEDEITWRVVSAGNTDKIRALGFFGLMAVGDHHRAHHIGMARGDMVH